MRRTVFGEEVMHVEVLSRLKDKHSTRVVSDPSELVGVLNVVLCPFRGFVRFRGVSDPIWWATSLIRFCFRLPLGVGFFYLNCCLYM